MKLEKGTMLGPYRIEESIGAGGMGEVFRARDIRLDRDVAIKVIPPGLSANEQLLARFEREAKVVSSLSHPHICVLHDVGETSLEKQSDGAVASLHYFVMELVDGETLDDRIRRGPIPTSEAVAIGIQIARALEHAHGKGVIHRDLKPSNVMLTGAGVKLLDFGLSKMLRESENELAGDNSLTLQRGITEEGVVLGTFQYMAPEQAEGKQADARTDVFALGAVLYEMVTGRRAFEGKSRASLIAAIMAIDPPDISDLRPDVPPALERVIASCLAKDPRERWESAHDVRMALELAASTRGAKQDLAVESRWRAIVPWATAALAVIAALALFFAGQGTDVPERRVMFAIAPGEMQFDSNGSPVDISPDGTRLLVGMIDPGSGSEGLFIRELDSLELKLLSSGPDVYDASWSWDGNDVLFFNDFTLKRIAANGGPITTLASTADSRGASWGPDGTILLAPDFNSGIHAMSASGGEARPVTTVDKAAGDIGHWRPTALPDGRHFLFMIHSDDPRRRGIYLGSFDGDAPRLLIGSSSAPVFAAPDQVLYHHENNLYAQTLDMDELITSGAPRLVAEEVGYYQRWSNPGFSASRTGTLAYHQAETRSTPINRYDRSGQRLEGHPMMGDNLDLSRDGSRLAVQVGEGEPPDLWVIDLERGIRTRLTSGETADIGPVWSPDGQWIAYTIPGNPTRFMKKRSSGLGEPELILEAPNGVELVDWSLDGKWLLLEGYNPDTEQDIMMIDLESDQPELLPVIATRFSEHSPRFSPDGRWISYQGKDSGRFEIFVQPFPPDGSRWQISSEGGDSARWKGDGSELYWISRGQVMAGKVDLSNGFHITTVTPLFEISSIDYVVDFAGETFIVDEDALVGSRPIVIDTAWR